jgi:hypothetical protein
MTHAPAAAGRSTKNAVEGSDSMLTELKSEISQIGKEIEEMGVSL